MLSVFAVLCDDGILNIVQTLRIGMIQCWMCDGNLFSSFDVGYHERIGLLVRR